MKVTARERGWTGSAPRTGSGETPGWWLDRALPAITIRHPGNHRYAWPLRPLRTADWGLPVLPYPRAPDLVTRMR